MRLINTDLLKPDYFVPSTSTGTVSTQYISLFQILNAPTVDAEPVRHGEWVKIRGMMPPEYMGLKECSVCGWHINPIGRYAFEKHEGEFRYCPYCGAKMDGADGERKKDVSD